MQKEDIVEQVRRKFERLSGVLDERGRRVWAVVEAESLGYGGQTIVAKATGLSRVTLHRELNEKGEDSPSSQPDRIRKSGGGRKKLTQQEQGLMSALEALVEPTTRGDPESPLRWTCHSTRQLAASLSIQGYRVSHQYCYLKIIITIHRFKQASRLGIVSRGKGLGRRLMARGWFLLFCKPITVDAIAFNKDIKA